MPSVCWGLDDACTNPTNFTVDKRCYVTDEQKRAFPYNTVVALTYPNGRPFCTGTIIKKGNETLIYTAKHCTDNDGDHYPDHTITIKTQNGTSYDATMKEYGELDLEKLTPFSGDWAIYAIDNAPSDLPFTELTSNRSGLMGQINVASKNLSETEKFFAPFAVLGRLIFNNNNYNARLVGYGSLKIMSDKEIQDFKDKYTKFLEENLKKIIVSENENENISESELEYLVDFYNKNPIYNGITNDGGLNTTNTFVYKFIDNSLTWTEYNDIFEDSNLKISFCQLDTNGYLQGCQVWGGNSGGPIFDEKGGLMGILTQSSLIIGGTLHAGRTYDTPENADWDKDGSPDRNINYLK